MSRVQFVSRADDLGSNNSANRAIAAVTRAGFIKNVSVMAPGPNSEAAARLLAGRKDICFGMHTTLNAEWDAVKWKPVLPLKPSSGLVEASGYFLSDPALFADTKPPIEMVMREVSAQLERLHSLGFDIRYIDSHMFPEMFIEGMDEAMEEFARKKGLIDHMYYYALPPAHKEFSHNFHTMLRYFRTLPDGQYFFVTHPSLNTEEMCKTGNAAYSGVQVARARAKETGIFSKQTTRRLLGLMGCEGVRYDKAKPGKRMTVQDVKAMLL